MGEVAADHWHPSAAYFYVLHLDGPALAWEYLRRHPDYRRDWLRRRRDPDAAWRWGLRLLEDPALDARDAHPAWFPDHDGVVQLYPDADPPPGAQRFAFWHLPGRKHLIHDGRRLLLVTCWPGCCVRLAITAELEDGMAYAYAVRAWPDPRQRYHLLAHELDKLAANQTASGAARPRPSSTELLELHTLQALDGTLAGASMRTVAQVLFGAAVVASDWHADGALRARVRRLLRRGQTLMRGDYRRLAQLPVQEQEQGRPGPTAKRP
jgi:hypothetical protein